LFNITIVEEKALKKLLPIISAISFALSVSAPGHAADEMATAQEKPSLQESNVVTATATVEAVDMEKRTVTLKKEDGSTVTLKVDESVKNLPQVEVGDQVTAKYYESVAVQVREPGAAPLDAGAVQSVATAKPGEKPAGMAVQEVTVTTTIASINKDNETVTLKGPDGVMKTVKVRDPKNLEKVEVGDEVVITYTEAVAISVEEPEGQ
jgi:Cu/Ag efflux protein CusF